MRVRLRHRTLAIKAAALLSICACGDGPAQRELQSAVLIVIDTLRADGLSAYGNTRQTSPVLDALARRGVLFERAVSHASSTFPGFVGILSARYPSAEVVDGRLRASLVERLHAAGLRTAAFTEGGYVASAFGMDLGFDEFFEQEGIGDSVVEDTFRRAREWLREHANDRFFLLVHTYECHMPYRRLEYATELERGHLDETFEIGDANPPGAHEPPFGETELAYIRALYDGGVAESDRHIGELLTTLEELGSADRTLVVVTSDHGEDLGDREPLRPGAHGHTLYDELLLVPLIVHDPRFDYSVSRVPSQVRAIDVMPTVLDLLGVAPDPEAEGRSLVNLMRGTEAGDRPAYSQLVTDSVVMREALRARSHKLIRNAFPLVPNLELYDLARDPTESENLAEQRAEIRTRLAEQLRSARAAQREVGLPNYRPSQHEISERVRRQLKALGYAQ